MGSLKAQPAFHTAHAAVPGTHPDTGLVRSLGMDGTRTLLEVLLNHGLAEGRLRGVFHLAIGRRVTSDDGSVLATGVTWRELAGLLKDLKYQKEWVRAFGVDPDTVAPRDKEKFWYHAIAMAKVDSVEARAEADQLTALLRPLGWVVGPPPTPLPTAGRNPSSKTPPATSGEAAESHPAKKKPKPKK